VLMLCPIVPHASHALWQAIDGDGEVINAPWPIHDESALTRDTIEIVVQVNGKVRSKMSVDANADKAAVEALALEQDNVQRFLDGLPCARSLWYPVDWLI